MAHHGKDLTQCVCEVLVISDTRTLETDEAGKLIEDRLIAAGHEVRARRVVTDDVEKIQDAVESACSEVDAVILTGGTGLSARDVTPEALTPLMRRQLPGFGETFRRISYDEIGAKGLFSRALAGLIGGAAVFALPGSRNACATAMTLVVPMLPHASGLART